MKASRRIKQLRAPERGYRIKLVETVHDSIGVDTPDDLKRVEQLLGQGIGDRGHVPRPMAHGPNV